RRAVPPRLPAARPRRRPPPAARPARARLSRPPPSERRLRRPGDGASSHAVSAAILSFLTGDGRDAAGRTFADVLALDDAQLEARHDFIQWLFPLTEPSRAVPGSPWLDDAALAALRGAPEAARRQGQAAARMLGFYRATSAW